MFKNIFKHLHTINKHRWFVFINCCKCGIPWQGFIHDLSKYSAEEFWESVKYYDGTRSPINVCKEQNKYSMAWLHHKGRNKHHYEFWQDNFDTGVEHLIIPFKYSVEMFCDFLGAGKAYMGKDFSYAKEYEFWQNKRKNCAMNPKNIKFMDACFAYLLIQNKVPNKKELKAMYELFVNE